MIIPLISIHLTHLGIHDCRVTFNEFEIESLNVTYFIERYCLYGCLSMGTIDRTKSTTITKFSLQYREEIDRDELNIHFGELNRFFSSF